MNYNNLLKTQHLAPLCVCVWEWRCVCACFTLAYACAILFNYRSGFEAEVNSAIITGNTSFNILWKSTPCVYVHVCASVCVCVRVRVL